MQHLSQEQLYQSVLDQQALSPDQRAHLKSCTECQSEVQAIAALVQELRLARSSTPSRQVVERYAEIFREHGPKQRNRLEKAWNWVTATLIADSRAHPLPTATRSVRADSYRLLYDSPQADVELYIERTGQSRRLQGDVMLLSTDDESVEDVGAKPVQGELLVQLQNENTLEVLFETVTNAEGRFQIEGVPPGQYRILVTGESDDLLEINELSLT